MLPIRIIIDADEVVTAILRQGHTARRIRSEAILDVNHAGRWIRGIELVGGTVFNLAKAVKPFTPRKPLTGESGGVTYDEEANAAFVYLAMKSAVKLPSEYSHSITPDAEFGFDDNGGLLWLSFNPREANRNARDFVCLIDAPVEG